MTSRKASHSAMRSAQLKSGLTMSSYFFGGFSAYLIEPSGRYLNH